MNVVVAADGLYHPRNDDAIIALISRARREGRTLRVRGDGHSVAHAIYADPHGELDNKVKQPPPAGDNINVILDLYGNGGQPGYRQVSRKGDARVIEVDGGMTLGSGGAGKGLLEALYSEGWALQSTGGIAHQTVAGFIATASAGGSLTTSVNELVRAGRRRAGSDLDGFIKPTVSGIERAADLAAIELWIRGAYPPAAADAILFGNAERVISTALS